MSVFISDISLCLITERTQNVSTQNMAESVTHICNATYASHCTYNRETPARCKH